MHMAVKRCFFAFAILIVLIIMAGCSEKEPVTIENFSEIKIGTTRDNVHKKFGEPYGMLSGFWGDIYRADDSVKIIVYYDRDGQVELIKTDTEGSVGTLVE